MDENKLFQVSMPMELYNALEKSKVRKQCTTTAEAVRACVKIALASEAAKE